MNSFKKRPRRLRRTSAIRESFAETHLSPANLVWPVFITEGSQVQQSISTLPGCYRWSLDQLKNNFLPLYKKGLRYIAIFPVIAEQLKNAQASEALNPKGLVPRSIEFLKNEFPDCTVISDIALDPFSSDGHDGLVKDGIILNDETVALLMQMSCLHAKSGVDFVAPSDMMDGRVGKIREALDAESNFDVGIISYAAKYASGFYGPFRDALDSAPKFGDKKTYQMDYRNSDEALLEVELDLQEGADVVMVKPGLSYLDILYRVKEKFKVPVAAYNVSGEYAMVKAAAQLKMIEEKKVVMEILTSFRRAGADLIFTYHAPDAIQWLTE